VKVLCVNAVIQARQALSPTCHCAKFKPTRTGDRYSRWFNLDFWLNVCYHPTVSSAVRILLMMLFQDLPLIVWRVFDLVFSTFFPQSLGSSS